MRSAEISGRTQRTLNTASVEERKLYNYPMGRRKRRVLIVSSAIVVVFIAYASIALLMSNQNRRVEHALDRIVRGNGFLDVTPDDRPREQTDYMVDISRLDQGEQVLLELRTICTGWETEVVPPNANWPDAGPGYIFRSPNSSSSIVEIWYELDSRNPAEVSGGVDPYLFLVVTRREEPDGVMDWLRSLWLW